MSDKNKSNGESSVKSGCVNTTEYPKVLGGYPEKHDVNWVDKQNSPQGRKRAPGSVRV